MFIKEMFVGAKLMKAERNTNKFVFIFISEAHLNLGVANVNDFFEELIICFVFFNHGAKLRHIKGLIKLFSLFLFFVRIFSFFA